MVTGSHITTGRHMAAVAAAVVLVRLAVSLTPPWAALARQIVSAEGVTAIRTFRVAV